MSSARLAVFFTLVSVLVAAPAAAQDSRKTDPSWPCRQTKTSTVSLASVWSGPEIDVKSNAWREDADVVTLVDLMSRRRVPIAEAEKAITAFIAKAGPEGSARLLTAFGAAFDQLATQRALVIDGLTRYGRKQHEVADRIRAENDAVRKAADEAGTNGGEAASADALQRLQWDIRIFEDRRRTVGYVCEAPGLIEQRIGAIARAVQSAL